MEYAKICDIGKVRKVNQADIVKEKKQARRLLKRWRGGGKNFASNNARVTFLKTCCSWSKSFCMSTGKSI